ncbi:winged helix-turn-helix transcriptional regulator [Pseudomonas corrugata]|uniref:winged helix-turn-helix transcriptional regulator n=1 Tax=Pseudomonas corrugata TaxID=47879 RepID=UPI001F52945E
MQHAPDEHDECRRLVKILARIGDKWTVMIIGALSTGPQRFNELRRLIGGVSQRMLTLTLRGLERDGLVTRTVYPTTPPRVDYELTTTGRTLIDPLRVLLEWANDHQTFIAQAQEGFDATHNQFTG